jgi:hypothetical protein
MKTPEIIQRIIELVFLSVAAIGFIVWPIAFYVLGIIYNLKQNLSIWWVMGLPFLIFSAGGIHILVLAVKGVKSLWKEIKKK